MQNELFSSEPRVQLSQLLRTDGHNANLAFTARSGQTPATMRGVRIETDYRGKRAQAEVGAV